jgi:nucleoside-diphosphate-sugar epimerase
LVIGGAGFIGRRLNPILVAAGHEITCVDIDGRIVNRAVGDLAQQLHERHDASDFDAKTQDKLTK